MNTYYYFLYLEDPQTKASQSCYWYFTLDSGLFPQTLAEELNKRTLEYDETAKASFVQQHLEDGHHAPKTIVQVNRHLAKLN
jgi:hypothetical protein